MKLDFIQHGQALLYFFEPHINKKNVLLSYCP